MLGEPGSFSQLSAGYGLKSRIRSDAQTMEVRETWIQTHKDNMQEAIECSDQENAKARNKRTSKTQLTCGAHHPGNRDSVFPAIWFRNMYRYRRKIRSNFCHFCLFVWSRS